MGCGLFSANTAPAVYASNTSTTVTNEPAKTNVSAPVSVNTVTTPVDTKFDFSTMTVAQLRNLVNPVSKYYDSYNAKAFLEDPNLSDTEKVIILCGKAAVYNSLDDLFSKISHIR